MASNEEGNRGIKRKSQESAEESASKHSCPADGGSTSTGITHDDQAQGNVREINWMKNCTTNDLKADPQCTICNEYHPFYIESSPFKDHCKEKHPDIDTEENESEWIFRYFDLVENEQHLKCKNCEETVKVLEFKGPFVKHFNDEAHKEIAERIRSQEVNEDAEEVKRRLTINFLSYLYGTFVDKYTKEGQRNVRKINWMKYCNTDDSEVDPQCTICNKYHSVYIDPSTFIDHCKKKHPDIDTEGNESEWMIFDYFTIVENTPHLQCRRCYERLEVLEFKSPFEEHFNDEAHQVIAERRSQGVNKNAGEVKRRLTIKFIFYLYTASINKKYMKANYDARQKAWWMKHAQYVQNNSVYCGIRGCPHSYPRPNSVKFVQDNFESHVQTHWPEVNLERNVDIWKYLSFDNFLVKCKRCYKILTYDLRTHFTRHLKDIHKIGSPGEDGESSQETNNDENTNEHIKTLMKYLMENYEANKPT